MPEKVKEAMRRGLRAGRRALLAGGDLFFPAVLARPLVSRWIRLRPPPEIARRQRGFDSGGRLEVADLDLNARQWGDDANPTILLVHGWEGWWQQLGCYVAPLVAMGFHVVTWDAPSHGDSPPGRFGPGRSAMGELRAATRAVAKQAGPVHGVVAHSAGAMAVLGALADGSDLGRIALVGPTLSMEDLVAPRARSQGWGARTQAAFWRLLDARGAFTVDALSSLKQVRSPLGSALLVHDRDDQEYPFEPVRNLQAQWPGAAVHRTDGLGHHHILWNDHVVQRVAESMAQGGHPEDR